MKKSKPRNAVESPTKHQKDNVIFQYKSWVIERKDANNIILRKRKDSQNSKKWRYYPNIENALVDLYEKGLLSNITEGGKRDLKNLKSAIEKTREEFKEILNLSSIKNHILKESKESFTQCKISANLSTRKKKD